MRSLIIQTSGHSTSQYVFCLQGLFISFHTQARAELRFFKLLSFVPSLDYSFQPSLGKNTNYGFEWYGNENQSLIIQRERAKLE
jgi:hypothetical protein